MSELYEELDRFNWTAEQLREYDSVEMKQAADRAILKGAFDEGKEEAKEEVARNMKLKGFTAEAIAELTQLSIESIEKL